MIFKYSVRNVDYQSKIKEKGEKIRTLLTLGGAANALNKTKT